LRNAGIHFAGYTRSTSQRGIAPSILTLWQKVVEQRTYMCMYIYECVHMFDRVSVSGMELCNGYRYWTLESRLMNTKHVNSRGKTVEWVPSSSFGQCLRSIEEVHVKAREPDHLSDRPFYTNLLLNSDTVARENADKDNVCYFFL